MGRSDKISKLDFFKSTQKQVVDQIGTQVAAYDKKVKKLVKELNLKGLEAKKKSRKQLNEFSKQIKKTRTEIEKKVNKVVQVESKRVNKAYADLLKQLKFISKLELDKKVSKKATKSSTKKATKKKATKKVAAKKTSAKKKTTKKKTTKKTTAKKAAPKKKRARRLTPKSQALLDISSAGTSKEPSEQLKLPNQDSDGENASL